MTDPATARDALVRGLEPEPGAKEGTSGWTRRYYALATLDALQARSPGDLTAIARRHLAMILRRRPGDVLIDVQPPRDPSATGSDAFATIDTCADDMPFIVDTVTMAVREAGVPIDWTAHPVLRLKRDGEGRLLGLDEQAPPESLIHFEIEPLADAAAYARLHASLAARFADLRMAVQDFAAMSGRTRALISEMARARGPTPAEDAVESREFLQWLDNDRFTYLAVAETQVEAGPDGKPRFVPLPNAGLGLARPGARFSDTDSLIAPPDELAKYAESPRTVVLTKALQRSPIHHDEFMDVVSVKHHRADGTVAGTTRFLGLFSGEAYQEPPAAIPIVRRKAAIILQRSGYDPEQHSGKTLLEILHGLPRDELFQSGEDELFQTCMGIMALRDRHQLRLFLRRDRYGRFFSAMVYLPRDRYTRELRDRVATELLTAVQGQSIDRTVEFLRGGRTRIHYLVRTPPGTNLAQSADDIERQLVAVTRPWRDQLREALSSTAGAATGALATRFADAFTSAYIERTSPSAAAADTLALSRLSEQVRVLPRLQANGKTGTRLKLYTWRQSLSLSDVLPTLENFGLRVIRQDPEPVTPKGGAGDDGVLWVQDFEVELPASEAPNASMFEEALLAVLDGRAEDDGLNRLVLAAGLDGRQVVGLRTLAKYLNQIGLPYGRADIERIIAENAAVAKLVVQQFEARFDPAHGASRRQALEVTAAQALDDALDKVASLDADRVLRVLVSVVRAGLRTNFWQKDANGETKPYVSLKLDPRKVLELPKPLPMYEIWVYAPEVEGIHLRGGRVARGGLRWSDRREDFRTEVLGLMKAQNVKNAVIVPVGAKGGFVVKKGPPPSERDAWMANGIACYKTFLRGLLDITDNRVGDGIEPPPQVVRHDDDDPYLVVAADKGTATFSDIANGLAADYGFWLGDAFASGGSAGYDHKKMGITARGAWESVARHFREQGKDIQNEAFTVVGVGDMSGDVFGNGMLLSKHIRLVAAFDHRHIFLDPTPVEETSFRERARMFALPRSSWADYDTRLISTGGGIFPRTTKHIKLSDEARVALGTDQKSVSPAELMRIILQAPVDLLWNGGIGTYVKASHQGHDAARDRANDMLRVDGRDVRAKVVGEGGNLGFTQAGRIEYARRGGPAGTGGRINTDAIDNSGGVHSSDREVNLKIPLNQLMKEEGLAREDRDQLLVAMTDDIARFVLRDSYVQSAAISLIEGQAVARVDEHAALIRRLEREGLLDRALEGLPDDEELQERRAEGAGLTRPEIAVLVAYAKISLKRTALSSDMSDDPSFVRDLLANFPPAMVEQHRIALTKHRLRREIIATILANAVVNRMGASFAHRLSDDHGVPHDEVLAAYAAAHELFGGDRYWSELEALDLKVPARVQYRLMEHAAALLKHATAWIIGARLYPGLRVGEIVTRYLAAVPQVEAWIPAILPPSYREDFDKHLGTLRKDNVPEDVAVRLARTKALGCALDVADLAQIGHVTLAEAAEVYFQVGERLRMPWLHGAIVGLRVSGHWQALARTRLRDDAYRLHRLIAASALVQSSSPAAERLGEWLKRHERRVAFSLGRMQELQTTGAADYASLAVAVRELHDLHALQAAPVAPELANPRQANASVSSP